MTTDMEQSERCAIAAGLVLLRDAMARDGIDPRDPAGERLSPPDGSDSITVPQIMALLHRIDPPPLTGEEIDIAAAVFNTALRQEIGPDRYEWLRRQNPAFHTPQDECDANLLVLRAIAETRGIDIGAARFLISRDPANGDRVQESAEIQRDLSYLDYDSRRERPTTGDPTMTDTTLDTLARRAYAADCAARPTYPDGSPRKPWERLCPVARDSWRRDPTPRPAR